MRYQLSADPTDMEKLTAAIMSDKKIEYFSVDKADNSISFFLSDWEIRLKANGKWEIT